MNLRLYIDEVGNGDLKGAAKDPNVRFLALTGIIAVRDQHDRIITPAMNAVKGVIPGHTADNPLILHRREIVRREKRFSALYDNEIRAAFDAGLLRLFRTAPYLAITVQIDKKNHLETYGVWHYDPYHYCMMCLMERYILYLNSRKIQGDVIAESRNPTVDKKLKASFERTYRVGTDNIKAKVFQGRLLSKTLILSPKKDNVAGIQMADLIAHPSARYMRFERDEMPQPQDFGNEVAKILVDKRFCRNPSTGVIAGYGTKWLP